MLTVLRRATLVALLAALSSTLAAQGIGAFRIHLAEDAFEESFSGDVIVAFAQPDGTREPRQVMHGWFGAPPVLRFHVEAVETGDSVLVDASGAVASFPASWGEVPAGEWRVQAVARRSRTGRRAGLDEGDVHSAVATIAYDPSSTEAVELELNQVVERAPFPTTERVIEFEYRSESLSAFHGFDYIMRAGVLLPPTYGDRERYPVLYSVTGFGGTHQGIGRWATRIRAGSPLEECIIVIPDASNRYGHSVFCDSDAIGPWGEALVHELIPALEAEFGGAGPEHRYVTGVSSGGWSSLWLQVAYPDEFAGCWSHVPDPIDFHDFQQINLYEPLASGEPRNMFVDENGAARPLARRDGEVMLTYEDFVRREHVLNPGGQIRSFEATFSPPGDDGTPRRVFDVETGVIDHEAARAWSKFDISHKLLSEWDELRAALSGKIHVYAGEVDTFYLEGAVERFQALARDAGLLEDMVIEVVPGMTHSLHQAGFQAMERTIGERWKLLGESEPD